MKGEDNSFFRSSIIFTLHFSPFTLIMKIGAEGFDVVFECGAA